MEITKKNKDNKREVIPMNLNLNLKEKKNQEGKINFFLAKMVGDMLGLLSHLEHPTTS